MLAREQVKLATKIKSSQIYTVAVQPDPIPSHLPGSEAKRGWENDVQGVMGWMIMMIMYV